MNECQTGANNIVQLLKQAEIKKHNDVSKFFFDKDFYDQMIKDSRKVRFILYKIVKYFEVPRKALDVSVDSKIIFFLNITLVEDSGT